MRDCEYKALIERLNSHLTGSTRYVSPTRGDGDIKPLPSSLLITKDIDVEQLSSDELSLMHVLLHKFYSQRTKSDLTSDDIERLHELVKGRMDNHQNFDRLDKSGKNR